jgi:hypothetical protein
MRGPMNNKDEWMDVFTIVEGKGNKDEYWIKIGRMFPHKNGDGGYNILLNALPINGKLVVKPRRKRQEINIEIDSDN